MIVAGAQGEIEKAWARSRRWRWPGFRLRVAVIPETSTGERDSEPVYEPVDCVEFRKEPAARGGRPGVEIVGSYDGVEAVVEFYPRR